MEMGLPLYCFAENTKHKQRKKHETVRKERREFTVLDGFEPDLNRFSRDWSSSKLFGKLDELFCDFNSLKIELETENE